MSTATTAGRGRLGSAGRRAPLRVITAGAAVATLVNVALWVGGKAAGVSFAVPDALVPEVGIASVVLTTPIMFAVGWTLLTLARRRGGRWPRAVVATAALLAVVSATAPLATAADTATGVLLATMHLVTGAAFVVTASMRDVR